MYMGRQDLQHEVNFGALQVAMWMNTLYRAYEIVLKSYIIAIVRCYPQYIIAKVIFDSRLIH